LNCLDKKPGRAGDDCWKAAKRENNACYTKVRHSHQPNREQIEAAKKAKDMVRK
jgi:hypothetical protein